MSRKKILFFASDYRNYRKSLFRELSSNFDIDFFWNSNINNPSVEISGTHIFSNNNSNYRLNSPTTVIFDCFIYLLKNRKIYSTVIISPGFSLKWLVTYSLCILLSIPTITWVEEWERKRPLSAKKYFKRNLFKFLVKEKGSFVVHGTKSHAFLRSYGVLKSRIFLAPHCSENIHNLENTKSTDNHFHSSNKVILYFGRVIPSKGLDFLIEAFSRLEKLGRKYSLFVVGEGDFLNSCKALANDLSVKNIVFKKSIYGKYRKELYSKCDVFVLPSVLRGKAEGWGLVINEAMSMGKPVVCTDVVGSAGDLVRSHVNGFVVNGHNPGELANKLDLILTNPKLQLEMSQASIKIFNFYNDVGKAYIGFKKAIEY